MHLSVYGDFDTHLGVICIERYNTDVDVAKFTRKAMKRLFITNHTSECFVRE